MDSGREFDCISPKTLCRMLSICRCWFVVVDIVTAVLVSP